jgi:hypothetical protein
MKRIGQSSEARNVLLRLQLLRVYVVTRCSSTAVPLESQSTIKKKKKDHVTQILYLVECSVSFRQACQFAILQLKL